MSDERGRREAAGRTENRRWLIGTGIGVAGLVLTVLGFWVSAKLQKSASCDELGTLITTTTNSLDTTLDQLLDIKQQRSTLAIEVDNLQSQHEQVEAYAHAQRAESTIASLKGTIVNAARAAERQHGDDFFDRPTIRGVNAGEVWHEFLLDAGFPSNPTEAQNVAREMMKLGMDQSAVNMLAIGIPSDRRVVDLLVTELDELLGSLAAERDENYSPQLQGNPDLSELRTRLAKETAATRERFEATEDNLNNTESAAQTLSANLGEFCTRLESQCGELCALRP